MQEQRAARFKARGRQERARGGRVRTSASAFGALITNAENTKTRGGRKNWGRKERELLFVVSGPSNLII